MNNRPAKNLFEVDILQVLLFTDVNSQARADDDNVRWGT